MYSFSGEDPGWNPPHSNLGIQRLKGAYNCAMQWILITYGSLCYNYHQVGLYIRVLDTNWGEFENTKGIIRIRKPKRDRQHHGQKKKDRYSERVSSSCSTSGTRRINRDTSWSVHRDWLCSDTLHPSIVGQQT